MTRPKLSESIKQKNKINKIFRDSYSLLEKHKRNPLGPSIDGQGRPPILYSELILRNIDILIRLSNFTLEEYIESYCLDINQSKLIGRPRSSDQAKIRYQIRRQEARIQRIIEGKEAVTESKLGRKALSPEVKIDKIKNRIKELQKQINGNKK